MCDDVASLASLMQNHARYGRPTDYAMEAGARKSAAAMWIGYAAHNAHPVDLSCCVEEAIEYANVPCSALAAHWIDERELTAWSEFCVLRPWMGPRQIEWIERKLRQRLHVDIR